MVNFSKDMYPFCSQAPRDRSRETMHHDPQYYQIRNHLIDFLVRRSKEVNKALIPIDAEPLHVHPGLKAKDASHVDEATYPMKEQLV